MAKKINDFFLKDLTSSDLDELIALKVDVPLVLLDPYNALSYVDENGEVILTLNPASYVNIVPSAVFERVLNSGYREQILEDFHSGLLRISDKVLEDIVMQNHAQFISQHGLFKSVSSLSGGMQMAADSLGIVR